MSPQFPLSPIAALAGLLLFGGGGGCGSTAYTAPPPSSKPDTAGLDTARVAQVDVPARIATSDTLRVHLSGTVGPNGCYTLARIEAVRAPGRVTVTPLVQPPTADDQACTMAVVPLDTTYAIAPPFEPGPFALTIPQPSRPAVTASVEVTDDP
ncbi:MAG: hypothetical protein V5A58_11615 [Salinibacter sp.]|uniref:hypothetical protein n=1 Tax=Salinibacter sp. TaxID=2065818 RepID=UPI002FC30182